MRYTIREIEERVYALLDENIEILEERTEFCDPGVSASGLVRMFLADAVRVALSTVPAARILECEHLLVDGEPRDLVLVHLTEGKARMLLPEGFLRLLRFRMSDWELGVTTPMVHGGEQHMLRRMTKLRECRRRRPAVSIDESGSEKWLEIFGTQSGATVAEFDFLVMPEADEAGIDLPAGVFDSVCERLAQRVRVTVGG